MNGSLTGRGVMQKRPPVKKRGLLNLAHDMPCYATFPHLCVQHLGCVPAHANWLLFGKGKGVKGIGLLFCQHVRHGSQDHRQADTERHERGSFAAGMAKGLHHDAGPLVARRIGEGDMTYVWAFAFGVALAVVGFTITTWQFWLLMVLAAIWRATA